MNEIIRIFICGNCKKEYEEDEEAYRCCSSIEIKYKCPNCGNVYEDDDEAEICCTRNNLKDWDSNVKLEPMFKKAKAK